MIWRVSWSGDREGVRDFDNEQEARVFARLQQHRYRDEAVLVSFSEVRGRVTLLDVELSVRKVRNEEEYYLFVKDDDYEFEKDSEKLVYKYIKEVYGVRRGTQEEIEKEIEVLRGKIEVIYTQSIGTDLKDMIQEAISGLDITVPRKTAFKKLMNLMKKLDYYNDLVNVIADEYLKREWFKGVIRSTP